MTGADALLATQRAWALKNPPDSPGTSPAAQSLAGWAFDPAGAAGQQALTAGQLFLVKVRCVRNGTVTKVHAGIAVAGVTLANCFAGVYSAAGTLLSGSANQSTAWQSTGLTSVDLSSPSLLEYGKDYWVALLVGSAGTMVQFIRGASNAAYNVGLGPGLSRAMTSGSGQSSLPATVAMGSAAASGAAVWAAIG